MTPGATMLAQNRGPCGQPLLSRLEVLGNVVIGSRILILTSVRSKFFPMARFQRLRGRRFDVNVKSHLAGNVKKSKKANDSFQASCDRLRDVAHL